MQFQPGQSGNPAGRPRGSRNKTTAFVQSLLESEVEVIAYKAVEMAKDGEIAAVRMCMDRVAPARRGRPIICELPPLEKAADSVAAMAAIAAGVTVGDLTASEAADLAKVVDTYVRTLEAHDFEQRLTKLESAANP